MVDEINEEFLSTASEEDSGSDIDYTDIFRRLVNRYIK